MLASLSSPSLADTTRASTWASTAQKASTLRLTVGSNLGSVQRRANASVIGMFGGVFLACFVHLGLCSVRIDVDQLLMDRASEKAASSAAKTSGTEHVEGGGQHPRPHRKRKSDGAEDSRTLKKIRIRPSAKAIAASQVAGPSAVRKPTITLTLGPRPVEPESFPCCLCISTKLEGLLRVHDPPVGRKDTLDVACKTKDWMAHEECAKVVPETWVDEVESRETGEKERIVFGVDGIVKDRWNLVSRNATTLLCYD